MEEAYAKKVEAEECSADVTGGTDAGAVASYASEKGSDQIPTPNNSTSGSDVEEKERETDENRQNAARRRAREREELIRRTRIEAIVEAFDGKNPYDGETMQSAEEVERFLAMKQARAAETSGDAAAPTKNATDAEAENAPIPTTEEGGESDDDAWFEADRAAFAAAHPDVDVEALISDGRFCDYAVGKVGVLPLSEIYLGYRELLDQMDAQARALASRALANRRATPGALGSTGEVESDYFSPGQVRSMSAAEVKQNYERIRRSMTKW